MPENTTVAKKSKSVEQKIKELQAQHKALLDERRGTANDARSLAKHFLPRKSRYLENETNPDTNAGQLRYDVLDGTGIRSRRVASAGMHGGMTSPARPWFRLTLQDEGLAKHRTVRPWLDEVQRRMRNLFARSNFYQAVHGMYDELISFGTHFMYEHEHSRMGLFFTPLTFGEYVLDMNEEGRIDTVFRQMDMTARNIARQFGEDNISQQVENALKHATSMYNKFPVVHAIVPREEYKSYILNPRDTEMQYASYYYERDAKQPKAKFLREAGYNMLPGFGSRWDVTGQDIYGGCPAMDSLGDVRMLQSLWATYLKQEHKRADPPVAVHHKMASVSTLPGKVNRVNATGGGPAMYAAYQVQPDPKGIQLIIDDVRKGLREGMYNDLFKMLAMANRPNMTATEVAERHEEKLLQLGPVLERLHAETFIPLIDRTFFLMLEQDTIPPWPEELDDMPLKVDFVSLLAQAQKMVATASVDQYMGFIGQMATMWPEAADVPNVDKVADYYADFLGIDIEMLNPDDVRQMKRQARAKQQEAAMMSEQMGGMAKAAKDMGQTPIEGGESTALDKLMSGMGG